MGGLPAWHHAQTVSRTSSFSNTLSSHGERLSSDILQSKTDPVGESKHKLQFGRSGKVFQTENKCGLREIPVQFSHAKSRRKNRCVCKHIEKNGIVLQVWSAHGLDVQR